DVLLSLDPSAPTALSTLSLHDALPIFHVLDRRQGFRKGLRVREGAAAVVRVDERRPFPREQIAHDGRPQRREHDHGVAVGMTAADRKSTRLNSSHQIISYAVFCLKKQK